MPPLPPTKHNALWFAVLLAGLGVAFFVYSGGF